MTDTIASAIEAGVQEGKMPWHQGATRPVNAATGNAYHGVNVLASRTPTFGCKIGAKVVSQGGHVALQMAEVAIPRQKFREILWLIAELRLQPPPAPA